ncbi:hypothetical protein OROHE_004474 [Orobanche hederae]
MAEGWSNSVDGVIAQSIDCTLTVIIRVGLPLVSDSDFRRKGNSRASRGGLAATETSTIMDSKQVQLIDFSREIGYCRSTGYCWWLKWKSATGVLCDPHTPHRLKGKFYRTAIRPALLYGTECWAVKQCHVQKMNVAEMRMLRWMCGHTKKDRLRNEVIREKVRVASIEDKMMENRLRWFGHVRRRPVDAPVRRLESWGTSNIVKGRGRPKKTWIKLIENDMRFLGIGESMAMERQIWRERIQVLRLVDVTQVLQIEGVEAANKLVHGGKEQNPSYLIGRVIRKKKPKSKSHEDVNVKVP